MPESPRVAVVVLAAGMGLRLGQADPKAFVNVGERSILTRALESVMRMRENVQIIVTAPPSWVPMARQLVADLPNGRDLSLQVLVGGETRQASVARALEALQDSIEVVLVHDAARPLMPTVVFDSIAAEVAATGVGVVPAVNVADTIKRVDNDGRVIETVDRSTLAAVQTPQGFLREHLEHAHRSVTGEYTDDAALVAAAGYPVTVIAGDQLGFKITTAWELRQAESLMSRSVTSTIRVGTGIDVHAYDPDRALWLGGLEWPDEPGLVGHSDGDVIAHAICDSLLSAARLGDMGAVFGTSNPAYANASGEVFLRQTVELLHGENLEVGNVTVQLIGNTPRLGARRQEMELLLSALIHATVSIAATTSDSLGFTGRGEGMAAIATALVHSRSVGDGLHSL